MVYIGKGRRFREPAMPSLCLAIALALLATLPLSGYAAERVPILLDTDIGSDIDDAFALALALVSPEVDLQGVTTAGSEAQERAWMVCRLLTAVGRKAIPVAISSQSGGKLGGRFRVFQGLLLRRQQCFSLLLSGQEPRACRDQLADDNVFLQADQAIDVSA